MPKDRIVTDTITFKVNPTKRIVHKRYFEVFKTGRDILYEGWIGMDAWIPMVLYHRPGCLVEIGVGESTFHLCKHGHDFERPVYSIDLNSDKLKKHTYTKYFSGHYPMHGDSRDVVKGWDKEIAILLIDGCHSYEYASAEFDALWPWVVDGGMVFIHDTYPPQEDFLHEFACGDVYRLRQELEKRRDEMDVLTLPYTARWMGLTVVVKKEKERGFWGK